MSGLRSIERRLNKHLTTILVGGIFFTFSVVLVLSMCNIQGCHDQTHGIADRHPRQNLKSWQQALLKPVKDISTTLIVMILSGPNNTRQRDVIRETWLKYPSKKEEILPKFIIGISEMPEKMLKTLERENFIHHDLLLLPDFQESYKSLAEKVLESFVWFDNHVDFKFLLKVDDDSFVRLDEMLNELKGKQTPNRQFYWGFFDGRAHVKKRGKWSEPDWILCDRYLPYALGGGYVLSCDLIHYIANNGPLLKKYNSEDVSVGAWLGPLDIHRKHDPRFDTEFMSRGCFNSFLITHKKSVSDMRILHNNIKSTGKMCTHETRIRKSYVYNWSVLPTECCIRNNTKVP